MTEPQTAAITNLGCKVNQAEMDVVERTLRERGVRLVEPHEPADLYVVNTCTVTSVADQKSRQAVRRARRSNPDARVVVTGCSVQVGRDALAAADPAAILVDNDAKDEFLRDFAANLGLVERSAPTLSGVEPVTATAIPGVDDDRTRIDRTRAFVKIQDGCSFHCTYCIIPRARGSERSLPPDTVLDSIERAVRSGHREVVLTGINIGTYDGGDSERGPRGSHRWERLSLPGLVRRILRETDVERLRLSSIEPQHVTDELLAAWTGTDAAGRCMPHVHLPLQSGDDGVLRRMGRRYGAREYASTVERIREAIPFVALHADVIAGFPTEDSAAFDTTVGFVRTIAPAGLHVFRYSERPGTPAARMMGQVDERERKQRAAILLALAAELRAAYARDLVGRRLDVLFESPLADGRWLGRAGEYTEVVVESPGAGSLENVRADVEAEAVDGDIPDRVVGTLLGTRAAPRVRQPLPVLAGVPSAAPAARIAPAATSSPEGADHAA